MVNERLQQMYRESDAAVRGRFGANAQERSGEYYSRYVAFVERAAGSPPPPGARLLDAGCGAGWSSFWFARRGYDTVGVDLNASFFEPPPTPGLTLREASALDLPFADESFDVVTMYQTLEHIPDPARALREMLRVCRAGGTVCVVGPNLLSLGQTLREIRNTLRHRPFRRIFVRTPDMQRHPFGNTLPETLASLPRNAGRLLAKSLSRRARFTMRQPDLTPPFVADNDACYLCNPLDLVRFFSAHGADVIQSGAFGRPRLGTLLAAGTWVAARKRQ